MTTSGIDIGPFASYPATDKGGLSFILDAGTAVEKSISFSFSSSSSRMDEQRKSSVEREKAKKKEPEGCLVLIRSGGRAKVNNPTVSFAFFTLFHILSSLLCFLFSLSLSSFFSVVVFFFVLFFLLCFLSFSCQTLPPWLRVGRFPLGAGAGAVSLPRNLFFFFFFFLFFFFFFFPFSS
ncbi:uncharacterized protein ARB_00180 [Trichophyton benhamiae CBS 112371]|uniref:Uncharacterized protein n=1 Tax=Arthroderma benhamiae (strain ATCC MYA-4681 / CBS 112371) TaxID=663331 RepID=D4AVG7_ARTBC|nr:uncharacterized protein ARB_00180 [Trichophyton benhamiae CBS 112371]EFE33089.1 hypothetical protein ARB_00180 [Trichophyton benhamiae CBS 112371]